MATLVTIDNENNNVLHMWILQILWVLLVHILAMLFHFLKPKLQLIKANIVVFCIMLDQSLLQKTVLIQIIIVN